MPARWMPTCAFVPPPYAFPPQVQEDGSMVREVLLQWIPRTGETTFLPEAGNVQEATAGMIGGLSCERCHQPPEAHPWASSADFCNEFVPLTRSTEALAHANVEIDRLAKEAYREACRRIDMATELSDARALMETWLERCQGMSSGGCYVDDDFRTDIKRFLSSARAGRSEVSRGSSNEVPYNPKPESERT